MEGWNYLWSASYGSPEYRPSAPGQVGRDSFEAKSATLLPDGRTVFLELPELKPIDQLVISGTLLTSERRELEQSVVLTLNSIPKQSFPERDLHRRTEDKDRQRLLASLESGLHVRESTVDRHVRQFAWMFPAAPAAMPGQTADRKISANGWIKIPSTGRYRFTANASPSSVLFRIAGAPQVELAADGIEVSLSRGTHPIAVEQTSSADVDVEFRLMWESRKFPREAVPASALVSDPVDPVVVSRQRGAFLLDRFRCANCHKQPSRNGDHEFAEALRAAPRLDGIGSRLQPDWISQWIRQPEQLRNHATMPAVMNADDLQTANDISAWLVTLTEPLPTRSGEVDTAATELQSQGAEHFERLGCIACHSFAPPDRADEWNRISLHFVAAKFQPQALDQFLREPHGHYPQNRMPDFRLTAAEVTALSSYLRRESKGQLEASAQSPPGNAERGKLAFQKLRCAQCHVTSKSGTLVAPDVPLITHGVDARNAPSCLAKQPAATRSPRFPLSDIDRSALAEFLATPKPAMPASYPVDVMIAELRCHACHARDLQASKWPEIVVEDGSGKLPDPVPHLTWVGEKLQGDWVEKFLKGETTQRPRPWLTARMPSFPAYASSLAHAMAAEHGVPFSEPLPLRLDAAKVEIGRQLTGREGGLDCRQCHGVGKQQPRGDESTQIALGINFALTKDRLRPEFAMRQLFDPPRYDSGSRMPRFAPDLQTTAARQIENGNARRQFESLVQYLWSVTPD
jgi:mono/diheme cytochrome c family protein